MADTDRDDLDSAIRKAQDALQLTDNRWEMLEQGRLLAINLDGVGEHNVADEVRIAMSRLRARMES